LEYQWGRFGGSFTLSMWIKPAAYDTWLGQAWGVGFYYFALQLTADGKLKEGHHHGSGWQYLDGTATVPLNEWTHVAFAFVPGGTRSFYVNGALDASLGGSSAIAIGVPNFPLGPFNGLIDEARLAEGEQSAARIRTAYLSESGALLAYGPIETVGGGAVLMVR